MKRRGLRVTLTAGAIGLVVVAVVIAFNWGVVRDHVEAWWFQATRETKAIEPRPITPDSATVLILTKFSGEWLLQFIADQTGQPVLLAASDQPVLSSETTVAQVTLQMTLDRALDLLRKRHGRDLIVQRFPRTALIVVSSPMLSEGKR